MLRELRIKNIVLIEALNIEFKSGLSWLEKLELVNQYYLIVLV